VASPQEPTPRLQDGGIIPGLAGGFAPKTGAQDGLQCERVHRSFARPFVHWVGPDGCHLSGGVS